MDIINPQPQTLSPSSSGRRCSTGCNSSPEFEFWMLRNPSFPQPDLLSADELIVDGVLLPLHLLHATDKPDPPQPDPETTTLQQHAQDPEPEPVPMPDPSPAITESSSSFSSSTFAASKRWKDIFKKKNAENNTEEKEREKERGKKKEKKPGSGAGSSELYINIWPFSRSRSAGTRPKLFPGAPSTRKVNSAPCSRSNSAGESKSRKWPSSPGRAGVHVGRSSPVWQVRRANNADPQAAQNSDKGPKKRETATCRRSKAGSGGGAKARVLNLNVPTCIGYRQHLSCRSDENGGAVGGAASVRGGNNNNNGGGSCNGGDGDNDGGSGVNLFNLRNLFAKKSIVTSH